MITSEARIQANRLNAQLSTGPRTDEGKASSRANSFKHGLTGDGVALPNEDLAEVERRFVAYREELQPSGEVGEGLVRRAAFLSVRLDRCVSHDTANLRSRIRQTEADFVAPDGADAATIDQLKAEAKALAMFDPSPAATLARRYEAAAERGYFRALKELRQLETKARAENAASSHASFQEALGSFYQQEKKPVAPEARVSDTALLPPPYATRGMDYLGYPPIGGLVDVPIMIGRRR